MFSSMGSPSISLWDLFSLCCGDLLLPYGSCEYGFFVSKYEKLFSLVEVRDSTWRYWNLGCGKHDSIKKVLPKLCLIQQIQGGCAVLLDLVHCSFFEDEFDLTLFYCILFFLNIYCRCCLAFNLWNFSLKKRSNLVYHICSIEANIGLFTSFSQNYEFPFIFSVYSCHIEVKQKKYKS